MSDYIRESLHSFNQMRGVIGICLHTGPDVVENLFPRAFSQQRVESFCAAIYDLFDGYRQAGRDYTEVCLKFNGGITYSTCFQGNTVSFLLEDTSMVPLLGTAAHTFLKDNLDHINLPKPAPGPSQKTVSLNMSLWKDYHTQIVGVMGKVIGAASSEKLMARMLASMGTTAQEGLPPARFRELGLSLVLEIPNRSKQSTLRKEIEDILSTFPS